MAGARSAAPRSAAPRTDPARRAAPAHDRARLAVLSERELARRAERRRIRVLVALGALALGVALFVVVVGQTVVASQQVRIDTLNQALANAVARNQDLQLTRAQLAAPARILQLAEHDLGMRAPAGVSYLTPVDPGPSVAAVGATAGR